MDTEASLTDFVFDNVASWMHRGAMRSPRHRCENLLLSLQKSYPSNDHKQRRIHDPKGLEFRSLTAYNNHQELNFDKVV